VSSGERKRVVIALGGNALLRRGEEPTISIQRRNAGVAAQSVAEVARQHDVVVTHGNGPQVGALALREADLKAAESSPLDMLVGETMAIIGYLLQQELNDRLPEREIATLLTQVEVDPDDAAFGEPTKPIGPIYSEKDARRLADERGWAVAPDGEYWRRVVPSPLPRRIVEERTINRLVDAGVLLICAGGGGIPVYRDDYGRTRGSEAVIDKDLTAELLARTVQADGLVLLTDVDGLYADWGTPDARHLPRVTLEELEAMDLASGSMGPKAKAAHCFVEETDGFAAIGALEDAAAVLEGEAGTLIVRE